MEMLRAKHRERQRKYRQKLKALTGSTKPKKKLPLTASADPVTSVPAGPKPVMFVDESHTVRDSGRNSASNAKERDSCFSLILDNEEDSNRPVKRLKVTHSVGFHRPVGHPTSDRRASEDQDPGLSFSCQRPFDSWNFSASQAPEPSLNLCKKDPNPPLTLPSLNSLLLYISIHESGAGNPLVQQCDGRHWDSIGGALESARDLSQIDTDLPRLDSPGVHESTPKFTIPKITIPLPPFLLTSK